MSPSARRSGHMSIPLRARLTASNTKQFVIFVFQSDNKYKTIQIIKTWTSVPIGPAIGTYVHAPRAPPQPNQQKTKIASIITMTYLAIDPLIGTYVMLVRARLAAYN